MHRLFAHAATCRTAFVGRNDPKDGTLRTFALTKMLGVAALGALV